MRYSAILLAILAPSLTAAAPNPRDQLTASVNEGNANYIFNSLIDSMRQFGASLHHNGMTLFPARVPIGTEFYHGTSSATRINGIQWLAFEPEHALQFARVRGPPGSGPGKGPGGRIGAHSETHPHKQINEEDFAQDRPGDGRQHPLAADDGQEERKGYLHTYRTKRELRLIYVDGEGAAKSTKGTLDTQDIVIRDSKKVSEPLPPRQPGTGPITGGPMSEGERASEMCALAAGPWKGKIDGIIRMEAGFEIILCDFGETLDVVNIQTVTGGEADSSEFNGIISFSAIAARYDNIGDNRVALDWENMVSLYTYDGLVYINDEKLPRIDNTSAQLSVAKKDLAIAATGPFARNAHNWQATADMLVTRYSDKIEYLASDALTSLSEMQDYTNSILRPHTDTSARSTASEISKCAAQFWPASLHAITSSYAKLSTPAAAFRTVAFKICSSLSYVRDNATTLEEAQTTVTELKSWLDWTNFKRCRGCKLGEFCFVPLWPTGTKEDFEHPSCRSSAHGGGGPGGGDSYWGGHGGPGGGHGGGPGGGHVMEVDEWHGGRF